MKPGRIILLGLLLALGACRDDKRPSFSPPTFSARFERELKARVAAAKKEIDLELAKQTLKSIVHDIDSEVGVDYIQKTVSEFFKVSIDQLKDKTRKKEIVMARQLAMFFAKEYTSLSLKSIGYHFGGRDHSTVIHAVQTVNDLYDTDSSFKKATDELRKKLKLKAI